MQTQKKTMQNLTCQLYDRQPWYASQCCCDPSRQCSTTELELYMVLNPPLYYQLQLCHCCLKLKMVQVLITLMQNSHSQLSKHNNKS